MRTDADTIGSALFGTGAVADFHHRAISANAVWEAKLVTVGDHNLPRSTEVGYQFGVPCVSRQELLERDDVDVVSICAPSGQHSQQATAVARARKDVLVEKPVTLILKEAKAMIDACVGSGMEYRELEVEDTLASVLDFPRGVRASLVATGGLS